MTVLQWCQFPVHLQSTLRRNRRTRQEEPCRTYRGGRWRQKENPRWAHCHSNGIKIRRLLRNARMMTANNNNTNNNKSSFEKSKFDSVYWSWDDRINNVIYYYHYYYSLCIRQTEWEWISKQEQNDFSFFTSPVSINIFRLDGWDDREGWKGLT